MRAKAIPDVGVTLGMTPTGERLGGKDEKRGEQKPLRVSLSRGRARHSVMEVRTRNCWGRTKPGMSGFNRTQVPPPGKTVILFRQFLIRSFHVYGV